VAENFERAVAALGRTGDSATRRVFAARRHLQDTGRSLADAVATHARERSRLHFEPPEHCQRDVRRLCSAAADQGVDIDAAGVLERAVPESRAEVLSRARAIRRCGGLSACQRERRLSTLLERAAAAGFAVSRADIPAGDGARTDTNTANATENADESEAAADRRPMPPLGTLERWLLAAGRNRVEEQPE